MTSTFIIAGASGDIGSAFIEKLANKGIIYSLSRRNTIPSSVAHHIPTDFTSTPSIANAFAKIPLTSTVYYFHLIGAFRFEDETHPITDTNRDGIDDSIYTSNLITFRNVVPELKQILTVHPSLSLTVVGIGSASDIYEIPFWQSFTKAKNLLRSEFRKLYGEQATFGRVKTCMINVSTVSGTQLANERPYLELDYCLTPTEVVTQALPHIMDTKGGNIEVTIIKPNPDFNDEFLELENIKRRWYQHMHNTKL